MVTTPWKPASLLTVTNKDANFTYRWIRKENLEKALLEGWALVRTVSSSKEGGPKPTLVDGSSLDSTIQKRNLILVRMPKTMAQDRNDFYAKKSRDLVDATQQDFNKDAKDAGANVYGKVEIK